MTDATQTLAAASKAGADFVLSLANAAFGSSERLAALNLSTSRALLDETVANARTLLEAKDVQEMIKLQAGLAQPLVGKATEYTRSAFEIAAQGQEEVAKVFEAQLADFNKQLNEMLEKAAQSAPAGSDFAVAAVKSALAAANSAYENVSKAAKQASEIAQNNLEAATEATEKAVRSTKKVA